MKLRMGDQVALGFDGSLSRDATALIACRLGDRFIARIDIWENVDRVKGWEVPRREVDDCFRKAMGRYRVARAYCDPAWWHDTIDGWHADWPKVVRRFDTRRDGAMAAAVQRFETAVGAGQLSHDGDPQLAQHMANARVWRKHSRSGDPHRREIRLIRKESQDSFNKMDAAIAAVLALEAAADAETAGAMRKRQPFRSF